MGPPGWRTLPFSVYRLSGFEDIEQFCPAAIAISVDLLKIQINRFGDQQPFRLESSQGKSHGEVGAG